MGSVFHPFLGVATEKPYLYGGEVLLTALVPTRSTLPPRLRRKVAEAITSWFERIGEPARILYRRGLVHFGLWLQEQQAIELPPEVEVRTEGRLAWEDEVCQRAGFYLLGFPFHEAVHLTEAYLADCLFTKPKLARSTTESRLASLRWAAREARRQNLIPWDLQTAKLPKPRKDKGGRLVEIDGRNMRGPEPEQKRAVLAAAAADSDPRVLVAMAMALIEGYREHEIRQIDLADVDLDRQVVMLVRKKRGEASPYPISRTTTAAIARWIAVRGKDPGPLLLGGKRPRFTRARIGQKGIFRWVCKCCEAAAVPPFSPHRLRHRAVTDMVNRGEKMGTPQENLLYLTGLSHRSALLVYYDRNKDADTIRSLLDDPGDPPDAPAPRRKKSKP